MSTEPLACPSCGSGVAEPYVETGDLLTCPYCESRYRVVNRRAVAAVEGPEPEGTRQLVPALLAVGLILLLSAVAAALLRGGEPDAGVVRAPFEAAPLPVQEEPVLREAPEEQSQAVDPAAAAPPTATWHPGDTQGSTNGFYVLGHVENTSTYTLDQPEVQVLLLDAQGRELAVATGYGERRQLAPGERSPAKVFVKDPPEHAEHRVVLELKVARFVLPAVHGLRVEPLEPTYDGSWGWTFQGKVVHEGTEPARFVKVEVQALDEDGALVGLLSAYVGGELLEPGEETFFKTLAMRPAATPDRFTYAVSGSP